MTQWYYSTDDGQRGPMNSKQLREAAAQGNLLPSDHIWNEELPDWVPASQLKGLFDNTTASTSGAAAPPKRRTRSGARGRATMARANRRLAGSPSPLAPKRTPQTRSPSSRPYVRKSSSISTLIITLLLIVGGGGGFVWWYVSRTSYLGTWRIAKAETTAQITAHTQKSDPGSDPNEIAAGTTLVLGLMDELTVTIEESRVILSWQSQSETYDATILPAGRHRYHAKLKGNGKELEGELTLKSGKLYFNPSGDGSSVCLVLERKA